MELVSNCVASHLHVIGQLSQDLDPFTQRRTCPSHQLNVTVAELRAIGDDVLLSVQSMLLAADFADLKTLVLIPTIHELYAS